MPIHNKLVRDKIPEVIEATSKVFSTRILDEEEYKVELKKKMQEELAEYLSASSNEEAIEELADLLELIHASATIHGASVEELEEVRKAKGEKRGGFAERIYLIGVEDD